MNFLSLEYFLAVAQEQNLTAAANKLYVSQQSLSEHVKKLEEELGTTLIIRSRPLELTPAGEIFAEGARKILDTKAQILQEITNQMKQNEQKIKLAISTVEAPPLLPALLAFFKRQCPAIDVEVVKRQKTTLPELMDGISFYFDFAPLIAEMEHLYFLRSDHYVIVCRQSLLQKTYPDSWEARLTKIRKTGDLALLQELPFAVLRDQSEKLTQFTQKMFDSFGISPHIAFQSDSMKINIAFCRKGNCAIAGSFFYERSRFADSLVDEDDPLLIIPLRTKCGTVPIALSYVAGKQFSTVERRFLAIAREFLTEYMEQYKEIEYTVSGGLLYE